MSTGIKSKQIAWRGWSVGLVKADYKVNANSDTLASMASRNASMEVMAA